MLHILAEIESMTDCCCYIVRTVQRNILSKLRISQQQLLHVHQIFQLAE